MNRTNIKKLLISFSQQMMDQMSLTESGADIIIKASVSQEQMLRDVWYFCQLINQIINKSGIQAYFEIHAQGFILFCKTLQDLKAMFTSRIRSTDFEKFFKFPPPPASSPSFWDMEFIMPRKQEEIEPAIEIIKEYWNNFNVTFIPNAAGNKIGGKLYFRSAEHYTECQVLMINALKTR